MISSALKNMRFSCSFANAEERKTGAVISGKGGIKFKNSNAPHLGHQAGEMRRVAMER